MKLDDYQHRLKHKKTHLLTTVFVLFFVFSSRGSYYCRVGMMRCCAAEILPTKHQTARRIVFLDMLLLNTLLIPTHKEPTKNKAHLGKGTGKVTGIPNTFCFSFANKNFLTHKWNSQTEILNFSEKVVFNKIHFCQVKKKESLWLSNNFTVKEKGEAWWTNTD